VATAPSDATTATTAETTETTGAATATLAVATPTTTIVMAAPAVATATLAAVTATIFADTGIPAKATATQVVTTATPGGVDPFGAAVMDAAQADVATTVVMAVEPQTAVAAAAPTARDTAKQSQFVRQRTGTADSLCCQPFSIGGSS
jgi:hypothetical protein